MAKKKSAAPRREPPRSAEEKLRGLVNLKIMDRGFYTQKELSAMLGISERTIRRFKNQKGYKLADRTFSRIRPDLTREDTKIKRLIDAGGAIKIETVTVRGRKRRTPVLVKDKTLRAPKSRILQLPVIYTSKAKDSQTIKIDVSGLSTGDKISELHSAHSEKRFGSWYARVEVPPGVGRSGRLGEDENVNDSEDDEGNPITEYYMIGPFSMTGNRPKMESEIKYHEDAGRRIVEISFVENIGDKND